LGEKGKFLTIKSERSDERKKFALQKMSAKMCEKLLEEF